MLYVANNGIYNLIDMINRYLNFLFLFPVGWLSTKNENSSDCQWVLELWRDWEAKVFEDLSVKAEEISVVEATRLSHLPQAGLHFLRVPGDKQRAPMTAALQRKNVGRHLFTLMIRWAGTRGTRPHQNLFSALGTALGWRWAAAVPCDGGIELLWLHPHVYPMTFDSIGATSSIPAWLP